MFIKCFFVFLLSTQVYALDSNRFVVPKNFKAAFTQERYIQSTDITLNSSGLIEVKNGEKLFWNQTKPFSHQIQMTGKSILAGKVGGLKEIKEPMAKYMANIMFNLFGGELEKLGTLFKLTEAKDYILLKPRDETMAKFIENIRVVGTTKIEKIKLKESSGNYLTISFFELKVVKP